MGKNSVRTSVRPYVPPLAGPQTCQSGSEGQPAGSERQKEGFGDQPAESEGQPEGGGWTGGRTDGRTEFLPFLLDFVPCRGRCPATFCDFTTSRVSKMLLLVEQRRAGD